MENPAALLPIPALSLLFTDGFEAVFTTESGKLVVTVPATGCFRVRLGDRAVHDYGIVSAVPARLPLQVEQTEDAIFCRTEEGECLRLGKTPLTFSLEQGEAIVLPVTEDSHFVRKFRLPPVARTAEGWFVTLGLPFGTPVYGGGEHYASQNRRGYLLDMWAQDALGVNSAAAYKNCPFLWSPAGYGVFVNTPGRVRAGVGYPQWSNQSLCLDVRDEALDMYFFFGNTPARLIERYTHLTGRAPAAPMWSLGVWLSKAYYRTPDETLAAAVAMRDKDFPCDVITLDGRAWQDTDTRFAFEWCPKRYADPKAFCDTLKALNYKICVWEYPLVSVKNPLFTEMAAKGWLLRDKDGKAFEYEWDLSPFGTVLTPLPKSGLVDFTNPEAYAFWRDKHFDLFKAGVDCVKSDFSEQVTADMFAGNGDNGDRIHNVYTLLYNLCVFEASKQWFGKEALVWGRSGWAGSQRAPMQWAGDSQSSWSALAASIVGGLDWGMSGCPYYAHDIGGFYGEQPSPELFVRWTQAGAMASHMRFHGIGPREPWSFGPQAEAICRWWTKLRYRLIPSIQDACEQAAESGLPVTRSMVLAFPDQPEMWAFEQQYMLGDALLVAPVLQQGGKARYRLPQGHWHDFWSGDPVEGGRFIEEVVPLDRIPVFVRDGTVLKLGPVVQHTGELSASSRVQDVVVYGTPHAGSCRYDALVQWKNGRLSLDRGIRQTSPDRLFTAEGGTLCPF